MAKAAGESVGGWFRQAFRANPKLLTTKSNKQVIDMWLKDHPGEASMPERVKGNMANVKSQMRKKLKRRGRPPGSKNRAEASGAAAAPVAAPRPAASVTTSGRKLEALEEQIDDCLSHAKSLDRDGLGEVIQMLRKARNKVVWIMGE